MPDHVHLFIRTRGRHLSQIVAMMKIGIRRMVPGLWWQRGYFDRIVRPHVPPGLVVRYLLGNPVRADLVKDPGDYPFMGVADPYL